MKLSKSQKSVLAFGLIALALVLTFVPFSGTFLNTHKTAFASYAPIWDPPSAYDVCTRNFGMYVSPDPNADNVGAANQQCQVQPLWSTIVLESTAVLLLTLAGLVLTSMRSKSSRNSILEVGAPTPAPQPPKNEPINLRELLKAEFGIDFPITGGPGNSPDSPIVILRQQPNDYTSCEYGILNCLARARSMEWKLLQQSVMHHNGRTLDQMKVQMTEHTPDEVRKSIENYYFDITGCVDF